MLPVAATRKRWPRIDPYLLVLSVCPFLVLCRNSNPIFTPVGLIDPWVYYGYFHNLVAFERDLFPGTYYGSRLPWLLPGYAVNRLFSPVAANYILHLSVVYVALFSLYVLLKAATDRRTALVGALLLAFYPYFWSAAGWDYIDGAGVAGFLLAMVFVMRAASTGARLDLLAAGAIYAAVFYMNVVWLAFGPLLGLGYLVYNRVQRGATLFASLRQIAIWGALGFVLTTCCLASISYSIDRIYFFYRPSLAFALALSHSVNPWQKPVGEWIRNALWLLLPAAAVLLLAISLASKKHHRPAGRSLRVLYAGQLCLAIVILTLMELKGSPVLQLPYYASYLIPFLFLAIGAELVRVPQFPERTFRIVVLFLLAALSFPWWGWTDRLWPRLHTPDWAIWAALLLVCAGATLMRSGASGLTVLVCAVIFYSNLHSVGFSGQSPGIARRSFERIAASIDQIEQVRQARAASAIRFWYDAKEPSGREIYSLNATYLWGYTMVTSDFPEFRKDLVPPGSLVVVASSRPDAVQQAIGAAHNQGERLSLISQAAIPPANPAYTLSFFNAEPERGP